MNSFLTLQAQMSFPCVNIYPLSFGLETSVASVSSGAKVFEILLIVARGHHRSEIRGLFQRFGENGRDQSWFPLTFSIRGC